MVSSDLSASTSIKYYLDEHIESAVIPYLKAHGIDVLTAYEAGCANQRISDADQLTFATTEGRVLLSRDQHFLNPKEVPQLLTGQHAGIIAIRRTASVGDQARFLRFVAETESQQSMQGRIQYLQIVPEGTFPDD